jgi:hypothetical protein
LRFHRQQHDIVWLPFDFGWMVNDRELEMKNVVRRLITEAVGPERLIVRPSCDEHDRMTLPGELSADNASYSAGAVDDKAHRG